MSNSVNLLQRLQQNDKIEVRQLVAEFGFQEIVQELDSFAQKKNSEEKLTENEQFKENVRNLINYLLMLDYQKKSRQVNDTVMPNVFKKSFLIALEEE